MRMITQGLWDIGGGMTWRAFANGTKQSYITILLPYDQSHMRMAQPFQAIRIFFIMCAIRAIRAAPR